MNVCKKEIFLCDTNLAILCSLEFGLLASERLHAKTLDQSMVSTEWLILI